MNKPNNITKNDWELLLEKYSELEMPSIIKKLEINYPIQYLIGDVDFCGIKLSVNENVLIPRFETEYLIEKTIKLISKTQINKLKVLDIGTGSGCIAIALAKELNCEVIALEKSEKAIEVATNNILLNKVSVLVKNVDIFKYDLENTYDLIISNPPYVLETEQIDATILYEPKLALFVSKGTEYYEEIIKKSIGHLNENGIIAFEIGATLAESIKEIANKYYPNKKVIVEKDYNNFDRYLFVVNK